MSNLPSSFFEALPRPFFPILGLLRRRIAGVENQPWRKGAASPITSALPLKSFQTTLLNEIAAFAEPFALVLKDYQVIESSTTHNALAFLIDHLPPPVYVETLLCVGW
ncbi:MAG: hypothetical protein ACREOI_10345 [bacterium]